MTSILDHHKLPPPNVIRDAMRFAAMIDIVLCREAYLRCYTFQPKWSDGVSLAKFDNGGGNDVFVFTRGSEAVIKGFDHESPVSPHAQDEYGIWPNIYAGLPYALSELLDDAAVEREDVTFCTWYVDGDWILGPIEFPNGEDDGASYLLGTIPYTADEYSAWANVYYEIELNVDVVGSIYAGREIDADTIRSLNADRNPAIALKELAGI